MADPELCIDTFCARTKPHMVHKAAVPSNIDSAPYPPSGFSVEQMAYAKLMYAVMDELRRAHAKFPDQHLPWGAGPNHDDILLDGIEAVRDEVREVVDQRLKDGTCTWAGVLLEEFCEALAEDDPERVRAELIQLAAMCLRTIADMDP